ncbi:hypothetical protein EDF46_1380 [Frondihabitans sp. PhB188]|uniref:hypothetical protein n=1 Tax=Frondihabitans sp. PhB188 TaxID=2485200 RepID=UPI000F4876CE|nr:hypothetical protein [Frondihabitans sp. PhB188]ROQ39748.1 hypothetical protein EDF46_1380 [Frondihabitans sp. PhB188]
MEHLVYLLAAIVTVVVLSGLVGGLAAFVVAMRQPSGAASRGERPIAAVSRPATPPLADARRPE